MQARTCRHAHAGTHTQARTRRHAHAGTHTQARTCRHAHACTHMHARTCMHAHAGTHMQARTCMHAHACTHMHARIKENIKPYNKYFYCILPDLYSVFFLQSLISISAVPAKTSSNSRSSNNEIIFKSKAWKKSKIKPPSYSYSYS